MKARPMRAARLRRCASLPRGTSMTPNDATLWNRWLERRDPDSLAEIFSRHAGMVFATCRRILGNAADAEDAAQECFADLLRARGDVRASLAAWLHTIAVRRSLDLRKAERRRREREQVAVPAGAAPERDCEREELLAHLDRAIDALPARLRVPVVRRFLSGETHTAIALELGVSEATVRYRIEKGIASLRRALASRGV